MGRLNEKRCKMGQISYGDLPFNSFIGNVALEYIVECLSGVPFYTIAH